MTALSTIQNAVPTQAHMVRWSGHQDYTSDPRIGWWWSLRSLVAF